MSAYHSSHPIWDNSTMAVYLSASIVVCAQGLLLDIDAEDNGFRAAPLQECVDRRLTELAREKFKAVDTHREGAYPQPPLSLLVALQDAEDICQALLKWRGGIEELRAIALAAHHRDHAHQVYVAIGGLEGQRLNTWLATWSRHSPRITEPVIEESPPITTLDAARERRQGPKLSVVATRGDQPA